MKQRFALPLTLWLGAVAVATSLLICQVQGGIITQQQSLTLPDSLASATVTNANETSADGKNGTRAGRVMYTASYSNVRIASKELKNLDKYFPIPAVVSKKSVAPVANIVPVLQTTTSTTSTTTSTTSTTTTTPAPPPSTTTTTTTTESVPVMVEIIPEIIEIVEETDPMNNEDEVVTETITDGGSMEEESAGTPTEQTNEE